MPHRWGAMLATFLAFAFQVVFIPGAEAQRGLNLSPDEQIAFVSKDVGDERWAIVLNLQDLLVTGNVFRPGQNEPSFLWCPLQSVEGDRADLFSAEIAFSCFGSDQCRESCPEWDFVADVTLPGSFFLPGPSSPGSSALCRDIPGCPPYGASCAARSFPLDEDVVGVGGRACTNAAHDIEIGSTVGFLFDHERVRTTFGVNAIDGDGNAAHVGFIINRLPTVNADRSVLYDLATDSPDAADPRGSCGNVRDGSLRGSINGFHQRLVLRKLCDIGEPMVGCFETEFQLSDGSRCEVQGEFLFFRTDDVFPPF